MFRMEDDMNYKNKDLWWASPYNEHEELTAISNIPKKVEIHDATLRDGEQTPGVVFTAEDKVRIAELLDEVGVDRIEAGMPAVSESDQRAIRQISKKNLKAKIFAFVRANKADIDMAVDCGVDGVVIEVPIGYPKLKYQFGWDWEEVFERSADSINYAKKQGLFTVYFPYDTTRSRESDLENLLKAITKDATPSSVGVVDTMGCATPEAIQYLVKKTKKLTDGLPVEVHTHNDFGMAVATEMAGVLAGAECIHSCVNGLGERTGNAALEELIVTMRILYGIDNGYDLSKLQKLCETVSEISGIPIPGNKPVTGARNYTRESGIGVNLVLEKPLAMFATNPALFGKTGDIVLGKKSGKASVDYFLRQMNKEATDEQVLQIVSLVKSRGESLGRLLTQSEFDAILGDVLK